MCRCASVSGTLGDAALALEWLQRRRGLPAEHADLRRRLDRPQPRVALGRLLLGRARAAIDISDGLVADLGHVCKASGVGAEIELARLPLSPAVVTQCACGDWRHPLAGGDDYELLFSVEPTQVDGLREACRQAGHAVQEIGRLVDDNGIALIYPDGHISREIPDGFDHFRS